MGLVHFVRFFELTLSDPVKPPQPHGLPLITMSGKRHTPHKCRNARHGLRYCTTTFRNTAKFHDFHLIGTNEPTVPHFKKKSISARQNVNAISTPRPHEGHRIKYRSQIKSRSYAMRIRLTAAEFTIAKKIPKFQTSKRVKRHEAGA